LTLSPAEIHFDPDNCQSCLYYFLK